MKGEQHISSPKLMKCAADERGPKNNSCVRGHLLGRRCRNTGGSLRLNKCLLIVNVQQTFKQSRILLKRICFGSLPSLYLEKKEHMETILATRETVEDTVAISKNAKETFQTV